mgnify:CR=1 FL=1
MSIETFKAAGWIDVSFKKPKDDTRVDAMYMGVYQGVNARKNILYWEDEGGTSHFGGFNEIDGKGSQPVTHWRPAQGQSDE